MSEGRIMHDPSTWKQGGNMTDEIPIHTDDQERIDAAVADYRHTLESLWKMAYLQGQIDTAKSTNAQLREAA